MLRAASSEEARAFATGLLLCAGLVAAPSAAAAADELPPQGAPMQSNNYQLDLFQGPTLASARVTGMGGAYAGLAEGAEGIPTNPAAASQRPAYSTTRTDYEITGGITLQPSLPGTDFDNNGRTFRYENFFFGTLGGYIQHDRLGIGSVASVQNYKLRNVYGVDVNELSVRLFKVDLVASYGFFGDQLHIGGGLRGAIFNAVDTSEAGLTNEKLLFGTYGLGLQGGALWRPRDLPVRFGGTIRSPVLAAFETGKTSVGSFYLPSGVHLPWEAEVGIAVQLGPRPLNVPWIDEKTIEGAPEVEAERRTLAPVDENPAPREPAKKTARRILRREYRQTNRQKLLFSFSMLVTGPTKNAVGLESMLTQRIDRSGERASVTMRAGAEAEVIRDLLQLRVGSYMEPTRFKGTRPCTAQGSTFQRPEEIRLCAASPRLHGTAGFEMRLLEWSVFGLFPEDNVFRVSGAVDVARDYFGWSLGIGSWY